MVFSFTHLLIDPWIIVAYFDTDWANCEVSCYSATGYAAYFGPNLIACHSKKQPMVSKSSIEAKYRAVGLHCSRDHLAPQDYLLFGT